MTYISIRSTNESTKSSYLNSKIFSFVEIYHSFVSLYESNWKPDWLILFEKIIKFITNLKSLCISKWLVLLLLISKIHIKKKYKKRGERKFCFMVKNSFISVIFQEKKEENKGSVEFQIVSFTNKIRRLTSHLELHKKDYLSQRGLRKILGKRQRLLSYLSKKKKIRYKELISELDIRESKNR